MPTLAKTTLNVPYWLTTEMGECRGWENSTGMPTLAKTTLNVLYRLTTEMGERNVVLAHLPTPYQLTTEMGERQGWAQKAIKLIYCPWGAV